MAQIKQIENPRAVLKQSSIRMQKTINSKYSDIHTELRKNLDYETNPMFSVISLAVMYQYVESVLNDLTGELNSSVSDEIETAYILGTMLGLSSRYEAFSLPYTVSTLQIEATQEINFSKLIDVKNVTMQDLLQMTRNTEYSVKRLIRDTMTKHLNVQNMLNSGRQDLANILIQELTGKQLNQTITENMIAIVDKGGRQWKVSDYVDMVTRTKAQQVYIEGLQDFANENGGNGDLARIPVNPTTNDPCLYYEGMIISMTGATAGYRTYDELRATGHIFHPRCRHTPKPYWTVNDIPDPVLREHDRKIIEARQWEQRYQRERERRLAERNNRN